MPTRKKILWLGVLTIIGFSIAGIALCYFFQDLSLMQIFETKIGYGWELLLGSLYGIFTGLLAMMLIDSKLLDPVKEKYGKITSSFNLTIADIFFVSFCAGVGEEIFFRGAIQPWLGVIITAIIFVAIHGYLNPKNWRLTIYGSTLTIVIIGIGYMTIYMGLVSAMAAHMFIDVVLFMGLKTDKEDNSEHSYLREIEG